MYPMRYQQALTRLAHSSLISKNQFSEAFGKAIVSVLADLDKDDLWDIIYQQLMSLEKPSSSKLTSILIQFDGHHQTLSLESEKSREELLEIKAIIVEEISMVSGTLFTFLSNMFGSLHKNHK
ncbi:5124_t:CDS:2, partial [Entrophospora sp. SA101]